MNRLIFALPQNIFPHYAIRHWKNLQNKPQKIFSDYLKERHMFRPAALFIGLRYTRAKRRNHFISFISLMSMLGIALGIIVLITVLSVMNGFGREIQKRFFGMVPPITVTSIAGFVQNWPDLEK